MKTIHLLKVEDQAMAYRIHFLYNMLRTQSGPYASNICYAVLTMLNAYNSFEKRDQYRFLDIL